MGSNYIESGNCVVDEYLCKWEPQHIAQNACIIL